MVILDRNINPADDRELVEDVSAQEIADKGLDFMETFCQVHRAYVGNRVGEEARLTDREIFNMVDNLLRPWAQFLKRTSSCRGDFFLCHGLALAAVASYAQRLNRQHNLPISLPLRARPENAPQRDDRTNLRQ